MAPASGLWLFSWAVPFGAHIAITPIAGILQEEPLIPRRRSWPGSARCREYFGPEGGVTLSGGEALCQPAFVYELFSLCHEEGIHTCLDTSGCVWNQEVERALSATDLVLLDIKMTREEDYRRYTGGSLSDAISFLARLQERGDSHLDPPGDHPGRQRR